MNRSDFAARSSKKRLGFHGVVAAMGFYGPKVELFSGSICGVLVVYVRNFWIVFSIRSHEILRFACFDRKKWKGGGALSY
jgi:hypothetical protein